MGFLGFMHGVWGFRNVLIVVLTPFLLLPIPLSSPSKESTAAYGIIVMAVYWISEALPISVTSLLPLLIFPVLGVAPAKTVAKQYVNDTTMMFVGGLMVALAIETWDLHKRIALHSLMVFGPEPKRLLLGLMLTTWFLSMWISNTATTAMMLPIADAILKQLKGRGAENEEDGEEEKEEDVKGAVVEEEEEAVKKRQLYNGMEGGMEMGPVQDVKLEGASSPPPPPPSGTTMAVDTTAMSSHRVQPDSPAYSRLCKAVCLSIAYSANVGGMATITGTGPNLVLKGQSDQLFNSVGLPPALTFANWMGFAVPLSASCLVFIWVWLILFQLRMWHPRSWCPCIKSQNDQLTKAHNARVKKLIAEEIRSLGSISFAEVSVSVCFVSLVLLWITRDLQDAGGWKLLFKNRYVTDATSAMFIAILLFVLPCRVPRFSWKDAGNKAGGSVGRGDPSLAWPTLLTWRDVEDKFNWGIVWLLGGGFALAYVSRDSGLSDLISRSLTTMSGMNSLALNLCLGLIVALMTEVTSNTATATILMPIMAQLAVSIKTNPLHLMFNAALAASFAFMLPVATPPNAIVFGTKQLKVSDMVVTGFPINMMCVLLLSVFLQTWGLVIFPLDTLPDAFLQQNTTTTIATNSTT